MDVSGMKNGDVAGLAAYNRGFSYVAVKRAGGVNTLGVVNRAQPFAVDLDQAALETFVPGTTVPLGDATEVSREGRPGLRLADRAAVDDVLLQPRRVAVDPAGQPRRPADAGRQPRALHGAPGRPVQLRDAGDGRARRLRPLPAQRHADRAGPAAGHQPTWTRPSPTRRRSTRATTRRTPGPRRRPRSPRRRRRGPASSAPRTRSTRRSGRSATSWPGSACSRPKT